MRIKSLQVSCCESLRELGLDEIFRLNKYHEKEVLEIYHRALFEMLKFNSKFQDGKRILRIPKKYEILINKKGPLTSEEQLLLKEYEDEIPDLEVMFIFDVGRFEMIAKIVDPPAKAQKLKRSILIRKLHRESCIIL